jgi:hypothetical protein
MTASLPPPSTTRRTTVSGVAGLIGLVAGLCTVFALVVTIMEWREEQARARWPIVHASIQNVAVDASRTSKRGTVWRLRCAIRYTVDGIEYSTTLHSRSASGDAEAQRMRDWAARHRRHDAIDARYDPQQPAQVVFADDDVPGAGPRSSSNIALTLIAAAVSVLFLALARHLYAREQAADAASASSPVGRIALGMLSGACGLVPLALGGYAALHADHALTSADLIFVPAALIFVLGGTLLALPPRDDAAHRILATLLVTAFAMTFDWIAFGPGERRFDGGFAVGFLGVGFAPGEALGRALFGVVAVVLSLGAAAMWTAQIHTWRRGPGS